MGIVVVKGKATKKDIKLARNEFPNYIKITADLKQQIVLIGGEYHADAEKILLEEHSSRSRDIWGGGYNLETKTFETNAIINMKAKENLSTEILDQKIRDRFLALVKSALANIESLLE